MVDFDGPILYTTAATAVAVTYFWSQNSRKTEDSLVGKRVCSSHFSAVVLQDT